MDAMRGVVYLPPKPGFPYLAVIFHSDGQLALTKPFHSLTDAARYIMDVASSLVMVESPERLEDEVSS